MMGLLRFFIRYGKKARVAIIIGFLVLCISIAGIYEAFHLSEVYTFFTVLALCILLITVTKILPRLKMRKLFLILLEQCDPASFLPQIDALLQLSLQTPQNENTKNLLIYKANALLALDKIAEAKQAYEALRRYTLNELESVGVNGGMVTVSLAENDLPAAEVYFQGETQCSNALRQKFGDAYTQAYLDATRASILAYQNQLESAKALLLHAYPVLTAAKYANRLNAVILSYTIGKIEFRLEKYTDAAPRLQFVLENGGTTVYRAKAAEMLQVIQTKNL